MNRTEFNLKIRITAAAALALFLFMPHTLRGQALTADRIETRSHKLSLTGEEIEYTLFVSSKYEQGTPAPLVVLLHGLGSNPQQVIRYEGITEQAEEHGYIVVAPYGYNSHGWYGSLGQGKQFTRRFRRDGRVSEDDPDNLGELSEMDVLAVLAIVRSEFDVDSDRIYLMGHSMGGGGTWYLGMKYHEVWAALAPIAPAVFSSPDELSKIRHMPVIVVQGENDRLVPVRTARQWVAKLKELEMKHEYIEIPDGDHVSSITENPEMIARVFKFFNAHTRRASTNDAKSPSPSERIRRPLGERSNPDDSMALPSQNGVRPQHDCSLVGIS